MGIGGNFWELLKPYARYEGVDFLRDKRVAVDLSFWIIQHDAAVRSASRRAPRNPHLRVTFFRTVNLFAKMGAFPVFVVDGEPPPLKAQARIERFCRAAGLDPSECAIALPQMEGGETPEIQRNRFFTKCVQECVELLELLGMPVVRARDEAEALCAQLNADGDVDACITADSDAFLFGATCVIKSLNSNSKEPFECYNISDIEAGLGLKRQHLIAISLLVGNDYDLHGVPGIGVDTAVRLIQLFEEDEILQRLGELGKIGKIGNSSMASLSPLEGESRRARAPPHCYRCGHPGSKRAHVSSPCGPCNASGNGNCAAKPSGFRCECPACEKARLDKEQKKHESWRIRVCQRISAEDNFPNERIIGIYLNSGGDHCRDKAPPLQWQNPSVEALVDFLSYYQNWKPSYTRERVLPMLTTIFLREMAANPREGSLLCGQFGFHSIQRIRTRFFHPFYVVKWKRVSSGLTCPNVGLSGSPPSDFPSSEGTDPADLMEEPEVPSIFIDDGCWFMATDENMELVRAAFPREVNRFLKEKEPRESKSKRKETLASDSPRSGPIQLSITEFYRSTKAAATATATATATTAAAQLKPDEDPVESSHQGPSVKRQKRPLSSDQTLSKSVRRRLLFD
ncbi:unnamed protein product [Spirodela intermedia]|uniref:Flap endonuclease GEN-like 1 n=1 Tax=Spirodela intermedia TaxID=51605 RepID=A0A7I8LNL1_SPIIN|nr:unnamed protein product [Spirodela intermedia]